MSVPYSFRTKIQTKRNIWKNKKRHRRNFEKIMCSKGSRNNRSRSVPRPHTYAGKYPTAHKYSTVYGISQGEKFANDFRRHANLKYKYGTISFWCQGYYVDTVGRNKKVIAEYIRNQLEEDYAAEQISIKEFVDPFTGNKK